MKDGSRVLALNDWDRYEYAKAERLIPPSKKVIASFEIIPGQNDHGMLDIEFQDAKGSAAIRLTFDSTGNLLTKAGYRYKNLVKYEARKLYNITVQLDTDKRYYTVDINGKNSPGIFFAPVDKIERIVFRSGGVRRFPNVDTPTDPMYESLPNAGEPGRKVTFFIKSLTTKTSK